MRDLNIYLKTFWRDIVLSLGKDKYMYVIQDSLSW